MKLNSRQRGMSTGGMLMVGVLIAFVAITGIKLYPAYYDDFAVATALKNMEEEAAATAALTPSEIRKSLNKRLSVSGVDLAKDNVEVVKDKGKITINVNYEVRIPMWANIDAVAKFSHSITVSK